MKSELVEGEISTKILIESLLDAFRCENRPRYKKKWLPEYKKLNGGWKFSSSWFSASLIKFEFWFNEKVLVEEIETSSKFTSRGRLTCSLIKSCSWFIFIGPSCCSLQKLGNFYFSSSSFIFIFVQSITIIWKCVKQPPKVCGYDLSSNLFMDPIKLDSDSRLNIEVEAYCSSSFLDLLFS